MIADFPFDMPEKVTNVPKVRLVLKETVVAGGYGFEFESVGVTGVAMLERSGDGDVSGSGASCRPNGRVVVSEVDVGEVHVEQESMNIGNKAGIVVMTFG